MSADPRREAITAAIQAGADGFLATEGTSRQVVAAIRRLADAQVGMVMAAQPSRPARDRVVDLRLRT